MGTFPSVQSCGFDPRRDCISGWCNGNIAGFDPAVEGSNPSPDAYGSVAKRPGSRLQICFTPVRIGPESPSGVIV